MRKVGIHHDNWGQGMTALLAYLRRRPWLPSSLGIIGIGISIMVSHRFGYLLFWAGAAATVSGMGMALAGEIGYRRQQAGRPR
jgi:hypothetical protein